MSSWASSLKTNITNHCYENICYTRVIQTLVLVLTWLVVRFVASAPLCTVVLALAVQLKGGKGGKMKGFTQGPAARQIVEPESITAHAFKVECAVVVK